MLTFNHWWGKFPTLKYKLWCTYALYKTHLRCACIQRGSNLIERSINTWMFSLTTLHAHLDLLLPSRLCPRLLLPSSLTIYVPPLLSVSRFIVEKEIQTMLTLKRLLKITCNLNATEPLEGVKSSLLLLRNSPRWANVLAPSCFGGPSERQLTLRKAHVRKRCWVGSQCTGNHRAQWRAQRVIAAAPEAWEAKPQYQRMLELFQSWVLSCKCCKQAVLTSQLRGTWALSPISEALCVTFLVLLLLLPIQQPSLGHALTERANTSLFPEPPPPLSQLPCNTPVVLCFHC